MSCVNKRPVHYIFLLLLLFHFESWSNSVNQNPTELTLESIIHLADSCSEAADFQCALSNYNKALNTSEISNSEYLNYVYQKIGEVNYNQGNFDSAMVSFNLVINSVSDVGKKSIIAKAYEYKAKILWRYGDNSGATQNVIEGIRILESEKDTSSLIHTKVALGDIYVSMGKLDDGEITYKESYELSLQSNDSLGLVASLEHLGVVEFFRNNYEKAIEIFQEAYELNKSLDQEVASAINLGNIGEAYLRLGDAESAIHFLMAALKIEEKFNFNSGIIFLYYTLGEVHHQQNKYLKAHEYYLKSLSLMEEVGEVRERSMVYNLIAQNYAAQNRFDLAYKYHQMFSSERDSITTLEKDRQLEELQIKYQTEQKDRKNAILEMQNLRALEELKAKEKIIIYQYITGIIILLSLVILIYMTVKLTRRKSELLMANNTKNKLFKAISHDLNGPIGNISALTHLLRRELTDHETELLPMLEKTSSQLSFLIKDLLSWSLTQMDKFQFENEKLDTSGLVDDCLDLLNFAIKEKKIVTKKNVEASHYINFDKNAFSTILRNVLTNAIKFSPQNSEISIETEIITSEKGRMVLVKVTDQGVGFPPELIDKILHSGSWHSTLGTNMEKGSGIGFTLIKEFVQEAGGSLSIYNNNGEGATVQFSLPYFVVSQSGD